MSSTVIHRWTATHYQTCTADTHITLVQHRFSSPVDASVKVPLNSGWFVSCSSLKWLMNLILVKILNSLSFSK